MRKKQTATNNELLKATKRHMNHKIFKRTSEIVNTVGDSVEQGNIAGKLYLAQFFSIGLPAVDRMMSGEWR